MFEVHEPDTAWLVITGHLDLYLIPHQDAAPAGARSHLLRVGAGEFIFGLACQSSEVKVFASPAPQTTLQRYAQVSLQESLRSGDRSVIEGLERWTLHLASIVSGEPPAGLPIVLDEDHLRQCDQARTALIPRHRLIWAQFRSGSGRYLGLENHSIAGRDMFFPVSRQGWIDGDKHSTIESIRTDTIGTRDPEWRGLQVFQRIVVDLLLERFYLARESERRRLTLRSQSRTTTRLSAFNALASTLKPRPRRAWESADALFQACQAIGFNTGIEMKPGLPSARDAGESDQLTSIVQASGCRARRVALRGSWWKEDYGSLLAFHVDDSRPVAILGHSTRTEIFDPSTGKTSPLSAARAARIQPLAYSFYRPFPPARISAFGLLRFGLKRCHLDLSTIALAGLGSGLLSIATPYATLIIFDRLIPDAERPGLIALSLFLILFALANTAFLYVRNFALLRLEGKVDASVQAALWDRLLSLPVGFFRSFGAGDLAQRSLGISRMRQILTGTSLAGILSGIFSFFSLLQMFYFNVPLALIGVMLVGCAIAISTIAGILQLRHQKAILNLQGKISNQLLQFISGISKFRVSGSEDRAFLRWANNFAELKSTVLRSRNVANALHLIYSVTPLFCWSVIFYYYGTGLLQKQGSPVTTGVFLAFLAAFGQFLEATLSLNEAVFGALSVIPLHQRSKPILESLPEVNNAKSPPGLLSGRVEINLVSFSYAAGLTPVLKEVSAQIEPGQFVAFVGASGSGKSTLFRLLLGFERPDSGSIYFDGQDLQTLDIRAVRRQMGVLLQTTRPVSGSIFENIVGSAPLTLEDAWAAAKLAGIDRDIKNMPMGMHTYLSEDGGGISGGQRQRLMIARAIAQRPRILLLDEATSALDNVTQAIVSRSLESLQATRIVIAHRLSTIANADRILVLDQGSIVQAGSYQELIRAPGVFQELAKRQLS